MKKIAKQRILVKSMALFAIYLIISVTFFTARAMAVLNYNISGDAGVEGFARRLDDSISITTTSDSNTSFITGAGTTNYKEIPLQNCVQNGALVNCQYANFIKEQISPNIRTIPFVLKQQAGTPQTKNGVLYIDGSAPTMNYFTAKKTGGGLLFNYSFTDYLKDTSDSGCMGSGIGYIEINVQGSPKLMLNILTQNCTVSGSYYADMSGSSQSTVSYSIIARDRAGNEYSSDVITIDGDFSAPRISDAFEIMRGGEELTAVSGYAESAVDIVVHLEDSNMTSGTVIGDLSQLNINPAVNIPYKNIAAACVKDTGNVYNCQFSGVLLKPGDSNINITITATDSDGNAATHTITKYIELRNNPGEVLFLGPLQEHCTKDLSQCFAKSGINVFRAEIDPSSSYEQSVINIGINSAKTFAICKLNDVWECSSIYTVPKGFSTVSLFLPPSRDDYGNILKSDVTRNVYVDDIAPMVAGGLEVTNSNNNNNCSVSGDDLNFKVRISENVSAELKIYINTSAFTTRDLQSSECIKQGAVWVCQLTVTDFSSVPNIVDERIIVEDLAGNKASIPFKFNVCQGSSDTTPNVIGGMKQNSIPNVDRRTASKIPIKVFIPVEFKVSAHSQIMYMTIDRCVAPGIDGLDVMSSGHYFSPSSGAKSMMVLQIGHNHAQLLDGSMTINCTVSARIMSGSTVFLRDEKEQVQVEINTFNQPLGSLDETTQQIINDQKERLRDIDSDIDDRKTISDILKTICDISDMIVKINSLLQTIKAVIYGVCLVVASYPPTNAAAQSLWNGVDAALSKVDTIVQKYVWPTGKDGTPVGYIWKVTCIIYNCKFYTLSGLIDTVSTAADILQGPSTETVKTGPGDAAGSTEETFEDGSKFVTHNAEGDPLQTEYIDADGKFYREYDNGDVSRGYTEGQYTYEAVTDNKGNKRLDVRIMDTVSGGPGTVVDSVPIVDKKTKVLGFDIGVSSGTLTDDRGNPLSKPISNIYKSAAADGVDQQKNIFDSPEAYNKDSLGRQTLLYDSIDRHDWIINPYRSQHYDGLCLPATIYNLQKERQVRCMYLSCMIESQTTGMPSSVCKDVYRVNECLYLDSAQYRLSSNIFELISLELVEQSIMFTMGYAVQYAYTAVCKTYTEKEGSDNLYADGWYSAGCGIFGAALKWQEISALLVDPGDVFKGLFESEIPDDPASVYDYCQGGELYAN